MKVVAAAVSTYLASARRLIMRDLFTITPNGTKPVINLTSHRFDISWTGTTYTSINIERGNIKSTIGAEVDTLNISVTPKATELVAGKSWMEMTRRGYFDEAKVSLSRLFFSDWATPVGVVPLFEGSIGSKKINLMKVDFDIKSDFEILIGRYLQNYMERHVIFMYMILIVALIKSVG